MTPEKNWTIIEIEDMRPICLFNVSDEKELKNAFVWRDTQPFLNHIDHQEGINIKDQIINYKLLRLINFFS